MNQKIGGEIEPDFFCHKSLGDSIPLFSSTNQKKFGIMKPKANKSIFFQNSEKSTSPRKVDIIEIGSKSKSQKSRFGLDFSKLVPHFGRLSRKVRMCGKCDFFTIAPRERTAS
jgi:hypothetical protein